MRMPHLVTVLFVALSVPTFASADPPEAAINQFTRASYRLTDADAEITLDARALPGTTRIHSRRGFVRVWFDGMKGANFLEPATDGVAVRWVRVRPGAADTAVLYLRIGDNRRLDEEAIRIERSGSRAVIRIARNLLPTPPPPPVVETPVAIAAKAQPTPDTEAPKAAVGSAVSPTLATSVDAVAPAAVPAAAPAATAAPTAEPAQATTAAAAAAAAPAGAPSGLAPASEVRDRVAKARARPRTRAQHKPKLGPLAEGTGVGMGMLLLVTCGLGLIYLMIKRYQGRQTRPWLASSIEIVGLKRLGGKHQLIVVRALGEDHLLSVQGGRTDVIASSPAKESAQTERAPGPRSRDAESSGILQRMRDKLNPTKRILERAESMPEPSRSEMAAPPAPVSTHAAPQFGAELLRFAVQKSQPIDPQVLSQAADDSAVAGIIRLRERFGRS